MVLLLFVGKQLLCRVSEICYALEVFPIMSYMGMCGPEGYVFSVVLVIDRVSMNFGHFFLGDISISFAILNPR